MGGINDLGQIVGSYLYASGFPAISHAFVYDGSTYTDLQSPLAASLNNSSILSTAASGINNLGEIVGNYTYVDVGSGQTVGSGFLDINGTFTNIYYPSAATTAVTGVNNFGVIVGYYQATIGGAYQGFTYDHGTYATLDNPTNAPYLIPTGINDAGDIVGYFPDSFINAYHGFLATPVVQPVSYSYTTIDYQAPYRTFLYDINDEGQILAHSPQFGVNLLYSNGSFTTLDNLNNQTVFPALTYSTSINDSGQIIGMWGSQGFLYSNGVSQACSIRIRVSIKHHQTRSTILAK